MCSYIEEREWVDTFDQLLLYREIRLSGNNLWNNLIN